MKSARLTTLKRRLKGIRTQIDEHTIMLTKLKDEEEDIIAKLAAAEEEERATEADDDV